MQGYGKMGNSEAPMGRKTDMMGRMTSEMELPSFAVPAGVELSGESGTAEVDWRMTGDGRIEITAINGVSLEGEREEEGETEEMES